MEQPEPAPSTAMGQEKQDLLERAFFFGAEFSCFFDVWCQQQLALFLKSSMHLMLYALINVLKYSYMRLVCKDVCAPSRPAVGPPSPAAGAFIIVKLGPLRDRLVGTQSRLLTHWHPACPLEFAYYFRPVHLLANACQPARTTGKACQQFLEPADVHRLLPYCRGCDHGALEGLFRTDPQAEVGLVFVEDQAVVEMVFFLMLHTTALLRLFLYMLLVD
ncbi:LOW QUALITY PROTEIN: uncharacterized protein ZSWIM9 [Rhynchocyon petersi]